MGRRARTCWTEETLEDEILEKKIWNNYDGDGRNKIQIEIIGGENQEIICSRLT